MSLEKIQEKILKIAIEIVKDGKGALFIIGDNLKYEKMYEQKLSPFGIFDRGAEKVLKGLAVIDGAVIIDKKGNVKDYGVMIKKTGAVIGYGTRHAAALTGSMNNNISILCSEEERKVKIFKNKKFVMQIDALQKDIEKNVPKISTLLESLGAGFVGTIGAVTLAPTLGIALIPGVLIFGGSYFAIKKIIKRFWSS